MSFSTCSLCCNSASYSSGVANVLCTPRIEYGQHPVKSQPETLQKVKAQRDACASELGGRLQLYDKPVDDFIDALLPCSTPYTLHPDANDPFTKYKPAPGREVDEYDNIVSGCAKLVEPFPAAKKLEFANTHHKFLAFPFHTFIDHHHPTAPDISVSFPGEPLNPEEKSWRNIAMVIESKDVISKDPFLKGGKDHKATIEQLAKNARNLMLAHGFLATFVVGVYGTRVRLARFDHACALVSQPFGIKSEEGARLLQKFFWHFTHPRVGNTVAGCDPTVMKLDADSVQWVKQELQRARVTHWQKHVARIYEGRRVEVYDEPTGRCIPYLLYQLLDVNGRLFSRATMVWRAIEDTRIWQNGRLVPDPSRSTPAKPRVLKEAWRQLVRTAEAKFYQRLNAKIPRKDWYGLATMVCGGDLGEFEIRWWNETTRRRAEGHEGTTAHIAPQAGPSNPTSSSRLFSSTGSASFPAASSVESPHEYIPHDDFPLPYPQHQTYSWRLVEGGKEWYRNRSHMRMVIDDVGRPLTRFQSTYELVCAVRDAIRGHKLAWEKAQVMHRDISVGNILIADRPEDSEHKSAGFLHDYDYSSMEPEPPEAADGEPSAGPSSANSSATAATQTSAASEDVAQFKERTGTYFFMAFEILNVRDGINHEIHHDLESFYWVLLWVVVRHTKHGDYRRDALCNEIFKFGDDNTSASAKRNWVENAVYNIPRNRPLTHLLTALNDLVLDHIPRRKVVQVPLTHDRMLAIFDAAIAMAGWPQSDWVACTLLEGEKRTGIAPLDDPASPAAGALVSAPALLAAANGAADRANVRRPKKRRLGCATIPEEEEEPDGGDIPRTDAPNKRLKGHKPMARSQSRRAAAIRSEPPLRRSPRLLQNRQTLGEGSGPT